MGADAAGVVVRARTAEVAGGGKRRGPVTRRGDGLDSRPIAVSERPTESLYIYLLLRSYIFVYISSFCS